MNVPVILRPFQGPPGQAKVLIQMFTYRRDKGYWPDRRALARRCGWKTGSTPHYVLEALIARGLVTRDRVGSSVVANGRSTRPTRSVVLARIAGAPWPYVLVDNLPVAGSGAESE